MPWSTSPSPWALEIEAARATRGGDLLDLTCGNPVAAGVGFPSDLLREAMGGEALLSWLPDPRGLSTAREAVAAYYQAHGARVGAESIILTASTSEAYCFAFKLLCEPGDLVAVPRPAYPLLDFLATLEGLRPVEYALERADGWRVDMRGVKRALQQGAKAVVVIQPSNPLGAVLHEDERDALSSLCRAHRSALITDEVFLDYQYARPVAAPMAGENRCLTIALSGLSKVCALPQLKCGWMAVSGPGFEEELARLELVADTMLSVSGPVQAALPALLASRHHAIESVGERIAENLRAIEQLRGDEAQWGMSGMARGWAAVLRGPSLGRPWAKAALDAGVVVHPGWFYELSDAEIVISLLSRPAKLREGLRRAASALEDEAG